MKNRSVSVSASIAMLFVCTILVVSAQPASAQVVFDAASFGNATFDHTISGGSDRVLVVGVGREGGGDVSVTYDGEAMTRIDAAEVRIDTGAAQWVDLFYLGEAGLSGAGTYEVSITGDAAASDIAAGAVSLENVSQDGPEATAAAADFESAGLMELDVDITTLSDGAMIVDALGSGFGGDAPGDGDQVRTPTGQTLHGTADANSNSTVMSTLEAPTAGVHNVGYVITGDGANRIGLSVAAWGPAGPTVNLSLEVEGATFAEAGGTLELSANDTMSAPFQWKLDDVNIGGATAATLSLSPTETGDSGVYTLDFDDGEAKATLTSNPVSVSIFTEGSLPVTSLLGLGLLAITSALAGGTVLMRMRK